MIDYCDCIIEKDNTGKEYLAKIKAYLSGYILDLENPKSTLTKYARLGWSKDIVLELEIVGDFLPNRYDNIIFPYNVEIILGSSEYQPSNEMIKRIHATLLLLARNNVFKHCKNIEILESSKLKQVTDIDVRQDLKRAITNTIGVAYNCEGLNLNPVYNTEVDYINVKLLSKLKELTLGNYFISNINLSNNKLLKSLCLGTVNLRDELDLSNNANLEELFIIASNLNIFDINSKGLKNLNRIDITNCGVSKLDLSTNENLQKLDLINCYSLKDIDISNNKNLENIAINEPINIVYGSTKFMKLKEVLLPDLADYESIIKHFKKYSPEVEITV